MFFDSDSIHGPRVSIEIEVEGEPGDSKKNLKVNKLKLPKPPRPEPPSTTEKPRGLLPPSYTPDLSAPPDLIFVDGRLVDEYSIYLLDQKIVFDEELDPTSVVRIRWEKDNFIYDKRIIITEPTKIVYWGYTSNEGKFGS